MSQFSSYQSGKLAEFYARSFLRLHGFSIVESRHITGRGTGRAEIDIIARRGKLLVFVEVKRRATIERGFAAIRTDQRIRLRRAAENYFAKNQWRGDARFDVIVVCGWRIFWARNVI
ncbi:MAG: YraN family protein [Rickettsiales bacterium]|nr:YraN family protein [Rickettsiales bacterium]